MDWRKILKLKGLVLLRKSQNCESCGEKFACEISLNGCWCSQIKVSQETRDFLRNNYKFCLCQTCLEKFEQEVSPA